MTSGSLTVVGSGIRAPAQITPEAMSAIAAADIVHYLVPDRVAMHLIESTARTSRNLADLYSPTRDRSQTYRMMEDRVLSDLRAGSDVCAVFYGHPGVFVDPSHKMIARAQSEGFWARMFPAVSAADSLYADLGLDPGEDGIQMYSATDFLLKRRTIDPRVPLVLWQISFLGAPHGITKPSTQHLNVLAEVLGEHYPDDHDLVLYQASTLPGTMPVINRTTLSQLPGAELRMAMTLVVPPFGQIEDDSSMLQRLGMS